MTEFEALLINVSVAEALPDAFGVKVRVYDTLWPGPMVRGKTIPLIENSLSVVLAEETETLEPLAVRVPD